MNVIKFWMQESTDRFRITQIFSVLERAGHRFLKFFRSWSGTNRLWSMNSWSVEYLNRYDWMNWVPPLNSKPFICIDLSAVCPCPRIIFKMKFCVDEKIRIFDGISLCVLWIFLCGIQVIFYYKLYIVITRYNCIYWLAFSVLSSTVIF